MSAQKDHVNDVRASSYDAATARPAGYQGTIDEVLTQLRAEPDVARPYWPLNMRRERYALLGFLGLLDRTRSFSGTERTSDAGDMVAAMTRREWLVSPEDDSVAYGVEDVARVGGRYGLAYAMERWPENFAHDGGSEHE